MDSGDIINALGSSGIVGEIIDRFFPYCKLTKRALDVYIAEIEKSDKPKEYKAWEVLRAKQEFRKLENINSIVELAQEYCTDEEIDNSSYSDNEAWYDRFFEKAGSVSEESVQRIWGQILAREIKSKGKTPLTVITILSEIDSELAKRFSLLCEHRVYTIALDEMDSFIDSTLSNAVLYLGDNIEYYRNKGLDLLTLNEMESIGLISTNPFGYTRTYYGANRVLISDGIFTDCIELKDTKLPFGTVMLTKAGIYLSDIISPSIVSDQHEVIQEFYSTRGYNIYKSSKALRVLENGRVQVINVET